MPWKMKTFFPMDGCKHALTCAPQPFDKLRTSLRPYELTFNFQHSTSMIRSTCIPSRTSRTASPSSLRRLREQNLSPSMSLPVQDHATKPEKNAGFRTFSNTCSLRAAKSTKMLQKFPWQLMPLADRSTHLREKNMPVTS